jgi:hypothetical protein
MSQRLQSSMIGISSSHNNYQQHEGQLQVSQSHVQTLAAAALVSEQHRAPRDEEDVGVGCSGTGANQDIDSCTLPLISAHVVGKQRPPQNQQQHIQPLLSPHPLMPSLLEKVRSVTSLSSEALSRSSAPTLQQPRKLDPKERFKGKQQLMSFALDPHSFPPTGAVAAVIGSRSLQKAEQSSHFPPIVASPPPPPPPPSRFNANFRPPAPHSRNLSRNSDQDSWHLTDDACESDERRKSDPGPPPNRRLE